MTERNDWSNYPSYRSHIITVRFVGGGFWCRCGQWKCPVALPLGWR